MSFPTSKAQNSQGTICTHTCAHAHQAFLSSGSASSPGKTASPMPRSGGPSCLGLSQVWPRETPSLMSTPHTSRVRRHRLAEGGGSGSAGFAVLPLSRAPQLLGFWAQSSEALGSGFTFMLPITPSWTRFPCDCVAQRGGRQAGEKPGWGVCGPQGGRGAGGRMAHPHRAFLSLCPAPAPAQPRAGHGGAARPRAGGEHFRSGDTPDPSPLLAGPWGKLAVGRGGRGHVPVPGGHPTLYISTQMGRAGIATQHSTLGTNRGSGRSEAARGPTGAGAWQQPRPHGGAQLGWHCGGLSSGSALPPLPGSRWPRPLLHISGLFPRLFSSAPAVGSPICWGPAHTAPLATPAAQHGPRWAPRRSGAGAWPNTDEMSLCQDGRRVEGARGQGCWGGMSVPHTCPASAWPGLPPH